MTTLSTPESHIVSSTAKMEDFNSKVKKWNEDVWLAGSDERFLKEHGQLLVHAWVEIVETMLGLDTDLAKCGLFESLTEICSAAGAADAIPNYVEWKAAIDAYDTAIAKGPKQPSPPAPAGDLQAPRPLTTTPDTLAPLPDVQAPGKQPAPMTPPPTIAAPAAAGEKATATADIEKAPSSVLRPAAAMDVEEKPETKHPKPRKVKTGDRSHQQKATVTSVAATATAAAADLRFGPPKKRQKPDTEAATGARTEMDQQLKQKKQKKMKQEDMQGPSMGVDEGTSKKTAVKAPAGEARMDMVDEDGQMQAKGKSIEVGSQEAVGDRAKDAPVPSGGRGKDLNAYILHPPQQPPSISDMDEDEDDKDDGSEGNAKEQGKKSTGVGDGEEMKAKAKRRRSNDPEASYVDSDSDMEKPKKKKTKTQTKSKATIDNSDAKAETSTHFKYTTPGEDSDDTCSSVEEQDYKNDSDAPCFDDKPFHNREQYPLPPNHRRAKEVCRACARLWNKCSARDTCRADSDKAFTARDRTAKLLDQAKERKKLMKNRPKQARISEAKGREMFKWSPSGEPSGSHQDFLAAAGTLIEGLKRSNAELVAELGADLRQGQSNVERQIASLQTQFAKLDMRVKTQGQFIESKAATADRRGTQLEERMDAAETRTSTLEQCLEPTESTLTRLTDTLLQTMRALPEMITGAIDRREEVRWTAAEDRAVQPAVITGDPVMSLQLMRLLEGQGCPKEQQPAARIAGPSHATSTPPPGTASSEIFVSPSGQSDYLDEYTNGGDYGINIQAGRQGPPEASHYAAPIKDSDMDEATPPPQQPPCQPTLTTIEETTEPNTSQPVRDDAEPLPAPVEIKPPTPETASIPPPASLIVTHGSSLPLVPTRVTSPPNVPARGRSASWPPSRSNPPRGARSKTPAPENRKSAH
ncbi:unnamed protein product [Cyclocybe aegerita]|uniref:Uncharacterized protein n=1 Tax=Cyclocybe aegerita TaxID=1973307 RepID=A0A8S0VZS8_CYCAE|nr:unnamed protein product [Cyclocybe aegerita]